MTSLRSRMAAAELGPAQVEVAVLVADLVGDRRGLVLLDRERQHGRLAEDLDGGGLDLDGAGGQVGVVVALGPAGDGADDAQAVLRAQRVGHGLVVDDHLDDAAGVAQVDERHAAVVAALGHPAAER